MCVLLSCKDRGVTGTGSTTSIKFYRKSFCKTCTSDQSPLRVDAGPLFPASHLYKPVHDPAFRGVFHRKRVKRNGETFLLYFVSTPSIPLEIQPLVKSMMALYKSYDFTIDCKALRFHSAYGTNASAPNHTPFGFALFAL